MPVLTKRTLNRALLGRQLLLERASLSVPRAVEHLVGLQAQEPPNPYVALWSRLESFRHQDLADLLVRRRAVRLTLMRGTIHLVTARDALAMWPVMRPQLERSFHGHLWGRSLTDLDLEELLAAGRELVEEQPRTAAQIREAIAERWPDHDETSLVSAVRYLLPMVQVPPRGVWGASGLPTLTTAERWLGRPLGKGARPDRMILRYLAAFGPASIADLRTWSGLTGLREVVERLRPRLRTFRSEEGRELFDVEDGLLPEPDRDAPPRFLPTYDNVTLSHDDRRRIVEDEDRRRMQRGMLRGNVGSVLVDGFVRGMWKVSRSRDHPTLEIVPLGRLSKVESTAVGTEGERLLAFVAGDAPDQDVRIARG
ncbi:MAG TPA: winged helix DNA-binding domain-containing protein [Actinomycetota bacterium]